MTEPVIIKLPQALDVLHITVRNYTELGDILLVQKKEAEFRDGKWYVECYLVRPDQHYRLIKGKDERPGA